MANEFSGPDFQALGVEMANGTLADTNAYLSVTGVTFPALMGGAAAGVGAAYACAFDIYFVVDADGIIVWRRQGWSATAARVFIQRALDDLTTGIDDVPERDGFALHAAYPNPFNPATNIAYTIDGVGDAPVDLRITDVRGRTVRTLFSGRQAAGADYEVRWDGFDDSGRPANSGMYLSNLRVRGETQSRFITLVK